MSVDREKILKSLAEIASGESVSQADFDAICDAFPNVLADLTRLRTGIEEYLLWRPGERGHAAAHRKLAALLKDAA